MKAGYLTTEFWMTTVVSLWSIFSGTVPAPYSVGIPVVAVGLYGIARGLAKAGIWKGSVGHYFDKQP